ncbi:katanin p80 WD40 repeat-containing subunit B1 isoform X3 [Halyomorpha halys]|uniref:katanin p80 WD40 repeat-containing subunit B1 isoform X3 n=1 Tax=Halyomorpha halys TaxID=286706 RepID=UPI0006D4E9D3|nr:katanin p80 WD40 repeat-containing subunit B1 isoform X3 [Halyomorpha halys]
MALSLKKACKLQDFVAHTTNVSCLALGHKSGHVLVTGGDDKKVNLWAIGKPNCIMSLSGHTTPIHSVRFGHTENQVCAGSFAGALKLWDLEAAKLLRTLTGHKGSVRAIEFHPYGDFITSGSADSTVKLWDIRKKGCIATYKGHTQAVNSLKFSPDGLWIASAGQDGLVKLWDLRIGRMLREFPEHSGPVNSVEFHPHEFLIASASQDNTLNFWDLEHFTLVSSSDRELPFARCLHFSSGGECLYAGGQDLLRVYAWEPARTITSLQIPWGKVQDIASTNDKLIGASSGGSSVSVWVVDTTLLMTNTAPSGGDSPIHTSPFSHGNSLRKSFNKQKPTPEAKKSLSVKTIEESERSETDPEDETVPEIPDVNDYRAIFQPSRSLNRSPPISIFTSGHNSDEVFSSDAYTADITILGSRSPPPVVTPPSPVGSVYSTPPQLPPASVVQPAVQPVPPMATLMSDEGGLPKTALRETKSDRGPVKSANFCPPTPEVMDFVPMSADRPSGLDLDDFLPKNLQRGMEFGGSVPDMSEQEVLSSMMRGHDSIMAILATRQRNLQIVYTHWQNKDLKAAVETAVHMSDLSVLVDFLSIITHRPGIWNLDICVVVLPAIYELLQSRYETHMRAGCDALRLILRNFTPVIKSNVLSGSAALGVDLSREERYRKCMKCYQSLVSIRAFLLKRQTLQGPLGQSFRELHSSLGEIDAN